jgi:hypothetical protein
VRYAIQKKQITPEEVLDTLTAIRRQSSIDPLTDAPREHSLRAMRVVLRDTPFEAVIDERLVLNGELIFEMEEPRALLAGCVLAFRRAGTGRNRGRGRLHEVRLCENGRDVTADWFEPLKSKLLNSTAS